MRLINTVTFEMREFFDAQIPRYAILSHRWGGDEISYRDFLRRKSGIVSGDNKVLRFCSLSREMYNCDWAWVDTCCIDKSSSAELTEAINSMFRWYSDAKICVAYLRDVDALADLGGSEWFLRGWTLQELLAPLKVDFYNASWDLLGTRTELAELISTVTGIRTSLLSYFKHNAEQSRDAEFKHACIAEKMFWASKRVTSRREDMAYCLMGLFDVNMPLLYGEGDKAFYRLQQEIIKESDDESIFAWSTTDTSLRGFFAASPHDFRIPTIRRLHPVDHGFRSLSSRKAYQVTNKGLLFQGHVLHGRLSRANSSSSSSSSRRPFSGIPIKCCNDGPGSRHPLILPVAGSFAAADSTTRFFTGRVEQNLRYGHLVDLDQEGLSFKIEGFGAGGSFESHLSGLSMQEIYMTLRK